MQRYAGNGPLNLGGGGDTSIAELAHAIREVVGFKGELRFDPSKPDGMPFKALDSSELRALGWQPSVPFHDALERTYRWFLNHETQLVQRVRECRFSTCGSAYLPAITTRPHAESRIPRCCLAEVVTSCAIRTAGVPERGRGEDTGSGLAERPARIGEYPATVVSHSGKVGRRTAGADRRAIAAEESGERVVFGNQLPSTAERSIARARSISYSDESEVRQH